MTRSTPIIAIVAIGLMCCFKTINSAATGYYYAHPVSPFDPQPFSVLRSTGQYDGITLGPKVVTSTRPRITIPPVPSLPPLLSQTPTQNTGLQPTPYPRAQTPSYNSQQQLQEGFRQRLQVGQQQQSQQQRQQQTGQLHRGQSTQRIQPQLSYPRVAVGTQYPNTIQPRIAPPTTFPRITTLRPTPISTQKPTPKPTPKPVVSQRSSVSTNTPLKANTPTAPSPIDSVSNSTQAGGLLDASDFYVVDGRQLKQYKVYEQIDNDIDQETENFIPPNFFLNSYHARIGPTHPLSFQVESRFSGQRTQQPNQLQQSIQQQQQNTIALGSGGLGFVRLPNGNVYLGSGSLGYISSMQRSQDVEDARTRKGATPPDAVHF